MRRWRDTGMALARRWNGRIPMTHTATGVGG
jgi:hypothetical protein